MKRIEIIFAGFLFTLVAITAVRSDDAIVCSVKYDSNETRYVITCNLPDTIKPESETKWKWYKDSKIPLDESLYTINNEENSSTLVFKRSDILNDTSLTCNYGTHSSAPVRLVTKTEISKAKKSF